MTATNRSLPLEIGVRIGPNSPIMASQFAVRRNNDRFRANRHHASRPTSLAHPSPPPPSNPCSLQCTRGTVEQRGEHRSRGKKKVPLREAGHDGQGPEGQGEGRKEPGQLAQPQEEKGVRRVLSKQSSLYFLSTQACSEYSILDALLHVQSALTSTSSRLPMSAVPS